MTGSTVWLYTSLHTDTHLHYYPSLSQVTDNYWQMVLAGCLRKAM